MIREREEIKMPYVGICTVCNATIEGKSQEEFGNALIEHHRKNRSGSLFNRCNVFQCSEIGENGKIIGSPFGLEATMEIVCKAWSGIIWYEKEKK